MIRAAVFLVASLYFAGYANAVVVTADSATASSQFNGSYDPGNTIDGSGLPTNSITDSHDDYAANNHWTTVSGDTVGAWIRWGFNSAASLGGIYIWNHRSNNIASNGGYEPTLFDLVLLDGSNGVIASLNDVALAPDSTTAQGIGFGQIYASVESVLFTVKAVQNANTPYTGLAEARFETSNDLNAVVPIPAALPLLAGGIGLMGLLGWRKKRTDAVAV